ncbi:late expression factor 11 [Phthorimaea operculella granulovirus]|uniref:Late expression factor 11 n=1 Tax=Phthorimaea operculella granulovirus TaxID=192584 RepID=Q8JS06_9BBAC|nr:late expression factor 11 [Phthorimaea operculella granulovirus]AAM70251.1 late expression factor 11 [Phthorimaea operculella granulovirus]ANY57442.1 late expression factor 11 [Phthorimaea operculella granulovirus]QBH65888.1 late expression factor 11 [Phthorimaea operculella granulovirus]QBH66018.1 late expression factor 11 [Phthorimaea operculella granulovirus]QBH66148.1 late expression factor 11 [Phthorimaea operculella granulovirus]
MLTKSDVYAIVREVINYKKSTGDTTDVTAHVETSQFASIHRFIKEYAQNIVIKHSDRIETPVTPHLNRLNYIFNLPQTTTEEYNGHKK